MEINQSMAIPFIFIAALHFIKCTLTAQNGWYYMHIYSYKDEASAERERERADTGETETDR